MPAESIVWFCGTKVSKLFRLMHHLILWNYGHKMYGQICHYSPAQHNLPIVCDKPTSITSRGGRSDRAPVQLHIEPSFTYDYIRNQYCEKWNQWQANNSDTPQRSRCDLDNATIIHMRGDSLDVGKENSSPRNCQSATSSKSTSMLQRFVRSVTSKTARTKSVECVWD